MEEQWCDPYFPLSLKIGFFIFICLTFFKQGGYKGQCGLTPISLYEKTGGNLPAQMTLYVDRQTCGTCKQYLPELMHEMKIDTVNVVMKNGQRVTIDSRAR